MNVALAVYMLGRGILCWAEAYSEQRRQAWTGDWDREDK
jgi:hypothetical protein